MTLSNRNPAILSFVIISYYKINFVRVHDFIKRFVEMKENVSEYKLYNEN